jgi:hypothetical protein
MQFGPCTIDSQSCSKVVVPSSTIHRRTSNPPTSDTESSLKFANPCQADGAVIPRAYAKSPGWCLEIGALTMIHILHYIESFIPLWLAPFTLSVSSATR